MTPLTPTIHERIARCNTRVKVYGLISGAAVELKIQDSGGTNIIPHAATGGVYYFTVPSLSGGENITYCNFLSACLAAERKLFVFIRGNPRHPCTPRALPLGVIRVLLERLGIKFSEISLGLL